MNDEQHVIERDGDMPLRFSGTAVGTASSYEPGKDRWTELTLYRTTSEKYVLHEEGMTDVDGEEDRSTGWAADDAAALIASLYKENARGKRYLTRTAIGLIESAAERDDAIAAALYVEV